MPHFHLGSVRFLNDSVLSINLFFQVIHNRPWISAIDTDCIIDYWAAVGVPSVTWSVKLLNQSIEIRVVTRYHFLLNSSPYTICITMSIYYLYNDIGHSWFENRLQSLSPWSWLWNYWFYAKNTPKSRTDLKILNYRKAFGLVQVIYLNHPAICISVSAWSAVHAIP